MRFNKNIALIIIVLLVYITTAYYSSGYHFADEHYQIIEFANYKLGNIQSNQLAWEYNAKLRSSIQPWIATVLIKTMESIGIDNHYTQMFLFRLLTAFLSLFSIYLFYIALVKRKIINTDYKYLFSYLLFLLWFIPYISVRFSSETWSTSFFIIAISLYLSKNKLLTINSLFIGLLLSLSFLFRFQSGVLIFSFVTWLFFIEKLKIQKLLIMFVGFAFMLIVGAGLDYLFYNSFAIPLVNYFKFNVLESGASKFGTEPWWMLIKYFYKYPTYPLGFLMVLSLVYYIIKYPKSLITFIVVPFLIIHILIPHKELRFLFPIAYFTPVIIFVFCIDVYQFIKNKSKVIKYILGVYILFLILINSVAIVVIGLKSTETGLMRISEYIYDNYKGPTHIISKDWDNPFNPFGLPMTYYITDNLSFSKFEEDKPITDSLYQDECTNLLVVNKKYYEDNKQQLEEEGFVFITNGVPYWIMFLNKYQKGIDNYKVSYLLELKEKSIKLSI